jgi:hypothetical protein
MKNTINLAAEIISAALLSSIVGAAIGIIWFMLETVP